MNVNNFHHFLAKCVAVNMSSHSNSEISTDRLLKDNANILRYLKYCKPSVRKHLIGCADRNLIQCFYKILLNIIKKNIKISKTQLKNINAYKHLIKIIIGKRYSLKKKREALQTGGFVSAIIAPVASLIASLIGNAIAK